MQFAGKSGGYWQFYQHSGQAQVTERQHLDWAWAGLPVMGSVQVRFEFGASLAPALTAGTWLSGLSSP